jgi:hypothetical protein
VQRASGSLQPGDFIVRGDPDELAAVARTTGVDFAAAGNVPAGVVHDVSAPRIAMYQRYGGGNMAEGWTRLVLEQFDFPYASLKDAELQAGGLAARYDVIVFPHDSWGAITGLGGGARGGNTPPEYRSGIGEEGVQAIREFVEAGGTLVAMGGATDFAIRTLDLGVRDALDGLDDMEFFCPGSTVRIDVNVDNPIAWGMPREAIALFWDSPAFEITARDAYDYDRVATYAEREILQSGWLVGEEHLANRTAALTAKVGNGTAVLLGIRAQHRAQTDGAYKLLFNALYLEGRQEAR